MLSDNYPVDDFLSNVTSFFTIDDTLTSMPFNNSNAILYYNRSAFKEAGLDPDSPPTTLEEVRSYSQTLVDEGVTEAGLTWPNHVWFVEHFYSVDGQTLLDAENGHAGQPTTMPPDNDGAVAVRVGGIENGRQRAVQRRRTRPSEGTGLLTGVDAPVLDGIGHWYPLRRGGERIRGRQRFYPTIDGDRTGPVIGGASWFVPSGLPQERQDDIGSFLEFMGRPESQITWHKGTGYYPIRQSAVEQLENDGWFAENPMYRTAFDR